MLCNYLDPQSCFKYKKVKGSAIICILTTKSTNIFIKKEGVNR